MIYKCKECNYVSKRLSNLVRHQNRLYPCNKTFKVNVCKREEDNNLNYNEQNNNVGEQNNNASQHNNNVGQQNNNVGQQNNNVGEQNNNVTEINDNIKFQCLKCKKELSSNQRLKTHEKTCNGLEPKQCRICLKIFTTQQGKFQHMKYVKCSASISPSSASNTTNNINNSTTNSHNNINIDNSNNSVNTNNIQINIRADFDKITNDHIQTIVAQLKQTDYLQMISDNIDIGKYVIPRTMEQIYFNDQFPEMQTLKKERRNDKLVGVHVGNGKWEKRLVDDIYNNIIGRVEDFHNKYFQFIEEKYKDVKVGSARWKQIMRPIKTFGNTMLWYEGFSGDNIENMGIQLNYPDEDDEEIEKLREKRNKEMEQLISEKVYEETLLKEKACIR